MKIILDMDEVVVDMMTPLLKQYNEKYQSDIVLDDITQWGLPEDMMGIFQQSGFFRELEFLPDAVAGISWLIMEGHDIILATDHSANSNIARDKVLWVHENLPMFGHRLMIGARKDCLQGDVIIDDNPEYLINSPCRIRICMDRPWNRSIPEIEYHKFTYEVGSGDLPVDTTNRDFHRVYNWQQIPVLFAGGALW